MGFTDFISEKGLTRRSFLLKGLGSDSSIERP